MNLAVVFPVFTKRQQYLNTGYRELLAYLLSGSPFLLTYC